MNETISPDTDLLEKLKNLLLSQLKEVIHHLEAMGYKADEHLQWSASQTEMAIDLIKLVKQRDPTLTHLREALAKVVGPLPYKQINEIQYQKIKSWFILDGSSQWITASNGLRYQVFKMQHIHQGSLARGKCYDYKGLTTDNQSKFFRYVKRHSAVIDTLRKAGGIGIPANKDLFKNGRYWWVIDEWIDGKPLDFMIRHNTMKNINLPYFYYNIAIIIHQAHAQDIVIRDLSPSSILVRSLDAQPFITDFELAKFLIGASSVSDDRWKYNLYRAPEVEAGSEYTRFQADLYSWARIVTAVTLGEEGLNLKDDKLSQQFAHLNIPKEVITLILKCMEPSWEKRPNSSDTLLHTLGLWLKPRSFLQGVQEWFMQQIAKRVD